MCSDDRTRDNGALPGTATYRPWAHYECVIWYGRL